MVLYYAVFTPEDDQYNIAFPDLDGAFSFGRDMSEALFMAHDLLESWLITAEDEGDIIPEPSHYSEIKLEDNDIVVPINVNLELARKKHKNLLTKKTLTIPSYLNDLGNEQGINFSQTLTEALKDKLGVS